MEESSPSSMFLKARIVTRQEKGATEKAWSLRIRRPAPGGSSSLALRYPCSFSGPGLDPGRFSLRRRDAPDLRKTGELARFAGTPCTEGWLLRVLDCSGSSRVLTVGSSGMINFFRCSSCYFEALRRVLIVPQRRVGYHWGSMYFRAFDAVLTIQYT